MREYQYLSDDELELLIANTLHEEVNAPKDLMDRVLEELSSQVPNNEAESFRNHSSKNVVRMIRPPRTTKGKRIEFRNYCMKVVAILTVAFLGANSIYYISSQEKLRDRGEISIAKSVSRQEILKQKQNRIFGKNTYYISNLFNQNNIFQLGGLKNETK